MSTLIKFFYPSTRYGNTLIDPPLQFGFKTKCFTLKVKVMTKVASPKQTSVKVIEVNVKALDPNNVVPAGFLKNGTYRLDFQATSKPEEMTSRAGKSYQIIECEFTDSQANTIKGSVSQYQWPALMREGKLLLGEGMVIDVDRKEGSTFADITLVNIGMPVIELRFKGE